MGRTAGGAPPTGSKIRNPRGWVPTETGTGGLTPTPCREQFIGYVRPVLQRGSWIGWAMRLAEVGFFVLPEIVHVEIAVGFEPVFVGLEARARTRRRHASALGKMRTTWVRRLISSLRRSSMLVLLRVASAPFGDPCGKVLTGLQAAVVEPAQFLQAVVVGLARQMVQRVAEEVDVAALEGGFGKHLADGCAKACVIVGDDELDAVEAAPAQSEQEVLPG